MLIVLDLNKVICVCGVGFVDSRKSFSLPARFILTPLHGRADDDGELPRLDLEGMLWAFEV